MNNGNRGIIIFDFDGTLVDSFAEMMDILNGLADDYGYQKVNLNEVDALRDMSALELIKKFNISKWKLFMIARKVKSIFNTRLTKIFLVDGMLEMLIKLDEQGCTLGILSSNSARNIERFLKIRKIECFDFVCSENNLFGKDRSLRKIMKKHKFNPRDVIYLGDEMRDIEAAKKAGVTSIAVLWGLNSERALKKTNPDYFLNKPSELITIYSELCQKK